MELTTFNVLAFILIPILAAFFGGWVGAFFGKKYQERKENNKMKDLRDIAIKALNIIKKYNNQSYKAVENQFNTDLSIAQKRTIIVLLHKLGIPVIVPANEKFDIHRIHFADSIIDDKEIEGIILQINQQHCDNLFFIDAENYFNTNRQYATVREVGKKYVKEVLAQSHYNSDTKQVRYPEDWVSKFGLGEYMLLRIFHEQACTDIIYDHNGNAIPDKINKMLNEIDIGLWDSCLFGSYEMYKNSKTQIEMSNLFQSMAIQQQMVNQNDNAENRKLTK